ncbi:TetR family transcriptional regulator [Defluviimonas sp. SAOS-178_SWC]|uniref:TetR family transcriptional regulator n=1 Tax=Defluviimonas sp. SAOS-178_SWC TaxID=3121287 RepID=UPI003221CE6C
MKTSGNEKPAAAPRGKNRDRTRTKEFILQVAIQEFSEKGLDGARVEQIAKRAEVNMRMIYHYYESKENLYIAALERVYADVRQAEIRLDIENLRPEMAFRKLIRFTFDHFQRNTDLIRLVMGENLLYARYLKQSQLVPQMTARLRDLVAATLKRGQEDGQFHKEIDAQQFWLSMFSLCWVPVANQHTLSWTLQTDLQDSTWKEQTKLHIEDILLNYLLV